MSAFPFTQAQIDAASVERRDEDACIVAGPGSGKTTVLVEYFRRLVKEAGADPLRILAITFTDKAAANMRKKLAEAFQERPDIRARLERAWVSTVHGFCARLLRENAVFAGIDPEFRVLDERESWRLRQDSIAAAMDGIFDERPAEFRALIRGLASPEFEEAVLNAYDTMRGAGIGVEGLTRFPVPDGTTPDDVEETLDAIRGESLTGWNTAQREHLEEALEAAERVLGANSTRAALEALAGFTLRLNKCKRGNGAYELARQLRERMESVEYTLITEHYARERALLVEILRRFDALYRERKQAAGALDYSDLEEFTVRLLKSSPETRARLQRQFDHILMDEFQDTNGQQAELIRHIRPPDRFYAVGDINQSIYGFRHAEPEGFQRYRDEIGARGRRLVELEENFRSRADILRAVETITTGEPGILPRRLVPKREFDDSPEFAVEAIVAATPESEGKWIARRILEMSGRKFSDFAVLVRNTESIVPIAAAFDAANIPYVVNRGRGFYESREVNDLVHLLRVIANPRDEVSLAVVLRSPLVGASDEDLLRLKMTGGGIGRGLRDGSATPHLAAFRERLTQWRMRRESAGFDRLLALAVDEAGYPWSPNVDKLLAQARAASATMSLDEFVEELALVRDENPREPDAPPEDSSDTVKIMTVHSAKGLEYKVVFVAALEKGVNNSVPVVGFSRRHGLGARWLNPATGANKSDLFLDALREEWKQRDEEESNRLLYVAMTRAEEHLVLSFSAGEKKPANWAKLVAEKLALDPAAPRESTETHVSPHGEEWTLGVRVAAGDPEPIVRPLTQEQSRPIETLAPPAVAEQHDANATVTALAKFAACPRQYYLGIYLGYEGRLRRVEEAGDDEHGRALSAGEFGTQVHALLADTAVPDADPEAEKLAATFRRSELGRRAACATRSERESDFLMAVGGLVVRGQIDLWFEEGGELVIVDYKTDDVRAADVAARAADYALQLRLYAMAVERMTGRAPDRACLHFLRPDRVAEIDLAPSLWESPEQVVREFLEAQSTLQFPLNEGERCRHCPFFKDLCPATLAGEKEKS
ncbi:MAG: UvrD-helicase domain-containing protein [Acidobacteria bacterium]|nr:UvrD-helicase domain-containing protein [Acidobacteriota bacterium]